MTPAIVTAADNALAQYRARVERDEKAAASVSGPLDRLWGSITGIDTAQGAARSSAKASRTLLVALEGKRQRATTDADLRDVVETISSELKRPEMAAEVARLGITGGVGEIAKDSARDLAAVAVDTGKGWISVLKILPWLIAAVIVLQVFRLTGGKRGA